MRRPILTITAALTLTFAGQAVAAPALVVPIDQSRTLPLPRGTRDVLIGNPAIADVNVLDAGKAVVVGRGYGTTNLIIIDQLGRTVMDRQIVVAAPADQVSVIRGGKLENYACAGGCARADGAEAAKP